jgi:hypothetical protein
VRPQDSLGAGMAAVQTHHVMRGTLNIALIHRRTISLQGFFSMGWLA